MQAPSWARACSVAPELHRDDKWRASETLIQVERATGGVLSIQRTANDPRPACDSIRPDQPNRYRYAHLCIIPFEAVVLSPCLSCRIMSAEYKTFKIQGFPDADGYKTNKMHTESRMLTIELFH